MVHQFSIQSDKTLKWWLFLFQPPGSVYLSSPFAFRHAVGHEDINRCKNYLLNCIWTSLMRLVMLWTIWHFINRSCTSVVAIYGSVIIHFRFRESRIVAVQCRVSLYQSRCSQWTFFSNRDDPRGLPNAAFMADTNHNVFNKCFLFR